jgi:hypothetical protein
MSNITSGARNAQATEPILLDAAKLDCYQIALQFHALATLEASNRNRVGC